MRDGYDQTVHGLLRKHSELLAEIEDASTALTAKQTALGAIEAALRVFDPSITPASESHRRGANLVNGLHRFLFDLMRQDGSVTTVGAARVLMQARGCDLADTVLVAAMKKRVGDALQKMRKRGQVASAKAGRGTELEYRLA